MSKTDKEIEYYVLGHYLEDIELVPFFPLEARDYIKFNKSRHFNHSNGEITLNLYTFDASDARDACDYYFRIIVNINNYIKQLYSIKSSKSFEIELYLTPLLKYLPSKNDSSAVTDAIDKVITDKFIASIKRFDYSKINRTINKMNINSGVTEHLKSKITIWRKSEWQKVLIHELIHLHRLEKCHNVNLPKTIGLSENYPRLPTELFCELQTWYVYCLLYNCPIINEVDYSLLNLAKILHVFDISQFMDFYLGKTIVNLKCSAEFYFIFKAMILYHIFFRNKDDLWIIDQTQSQLKEDKMAVIVSKIIDDVAHDKDFNGKIDFYLSKLNYTFKDTNIYFMNCVNPLYAISKK